MNKIRIALAVYMLFAAALGIWFYRSTLAREVALGKSFKIVFTYPPDESSRAGMDAFLMTYEPSSRNFRFVKPDKKLRLSGSSYNRAYESIRQIESMEPERDSFFYAELPASAAAPHEYLSSFASSWRSDPYRPVKFLQLVISLMRSRSCNLSWPDALTFYLEILHAGPLGFSYEEISLKNKEESESLAPAADAGEKIKIRFVDASGTKKDIEKTFSYLRSRGFDPVDFRKVKARKKTEIISHGEDASAARKLAETLGLKYTSIKVKKEKYNIYGAEIVAGEDFNWR